MQVVKIPMVTLLFASAFSLTGLACSDDDGDDKYACGDLRERIAEIESSAPAGDQSFESVEGGAELAIERDNLRAQLASRGCSA